MARSLEAFYDRFGIASTDAADPLSAPAQELLARNLDGALFRVELIRLADEMRQTLDAVDHLRGWVAKLEGDVATLQAELAAEVQERRRLGEENASLRLDKAAFDRLPAIVRRVLRKLARRAGR